MSEFIFQLLDRTMISESSSSTSHPQPATRRLCVIRGNLWCVCPKLSNVIKTIWSPMSGGDKLFVEKNFPALDDLFIGKDVIPKRSALIRYFSCCFLPVRDLWYESTLKAGNDNWCIGLVSLRGTK